MGLRRGALSFEVQGIKPLSATLVSHTGTVSVLVAIFLIKLSVNVSEKVAKDSPRAWVSATHM